VTIDAVFHRPLRFAAAGLTFAGTALAGISAVLASRRHLGTSQVLAFSAVAVVTAGVALAVLVAARWALWLVAIVFGGQVFAVIGTIVELVAGVDAGKAADLQALGFDPTLGVSINLAYSAIAVGLCGWLVARYRRQRATAPPRPAAAATPARRRRGAAGRARRGPSGSRPPTH
jgi:hypothetical protein